ncbi:MAG: hypothetical protein DHS20C18_53100 [Saprospiraceae bacterium]|nr:MAG: hypothetical protein DHS20C18_53100 [Saprospiraceae bacterium]
MHLDKDKPEVIFDYLQEIGFLAPEETIRSAEKAGEGNMNYTLRIHTSSRSFILKQARPYVEKYPSIPAPVERAQKESSFFQVAGQWPDVGDRLPRLLNFDPQNHLQIIEDLGEGADFSLYYQREKHFPEAELRTLLHFLKALHVQSRNHQPKEDFSNRAMRELNHLHIFDFPFQSDNGLNLDEIQPGLQSLASRTVHQHPGLQKKALALGQRYLADGDTLLHGDFFPGSWLQTNHGLFIIDPEFCFRGEAAFDLGVCLAHLRFCGMHWQPILSLFVSHYGAFDQMACQEFAAIEILRRLYGVAQLPLDLNLQEKAALTWEAINFLSN